MASSAQRSKTRTQGTSQSAVAEGSSQYRDNVENTNVKHTISLGSSKPSKSSTAVPPEFAPLASASSARSSEFMDDGESMTSASDEEFDGASGAVAALTTAQIAAAAPAPDDIPMVPLALQATRSAEEDTAPRKVEWLPVDQQPIEERYISQGVHLHPDCTPCAFAARPKGCLAGFMCKRCHHPDHAGQTKCSLKRAEYKRKRAAQIAAGEFVPKPNQKKQEKRKEEEAAADTRNGQAYPPRSYESSLSLAFGRNAQRSAATGGSGSSSSNSKGARAHPQQGQWDFGVQQHHAARDLQQQPRMNVQQRQQLAAPNQQWRNAGYSSQDYWGADSSSSVAMPPPAYYHAAARASAPYGYEPELFSQYAATTMQQGRAGLGMPPMSPEYVDASHASTSPFAIQSPWRL